MNYKKLAIIALVLTAILAFIITFTIIYTSETKTGMKLRKQKELYDKLTSSTYCDKEPNVIDDPLCFHKQVEA